MAVLSAKARWLVPAAVAAAVTATGGVIAVASSAAPSLPPKSAAQLLVDLQRSHLTPFSGTVVQTADLGLPALPDSAPGAGLTDLLAGNTTVRLWYGGPDKMRAAVLANLGESDIIRNGRQIWTWDSDRNTYSHTTLTGDPSTSAPQVGSTNPQEAADAALKLLGQSTNVSTDGTAQVAHRKAYELVLSPKNQGDSLIGQVRIAVDAEHSVPLRVQVFAKGAGRPAYQVGFTQVSFQPPGAEQFAFTPPKGSHEVPAASILQGGEIDPSQLDPDSQRQRGAVVERASTVIGHGWSAVVVYHADAAPLSGPLGSVLDRLPRVSGKWGSGRLFSGPLFSVVLTDDQRVAVGPVTPDALYRALGTK
jgi:outer membrane lipoprotein-sorting protein